MHIFKKSKIENMKKTEQKSMKNRMFFGTSILKGFWEGFGKGFGRPKSLIFALFSMFFRCHFTGAVGKAKKTTKMSQQDAESDFLELGSGDPQAPGERKG